MSKEELIKELLQHELNQFRYSVFAKFNEENELEFAFCLNGSKPAGYEIRLFDIGGDPDTRYTYNFLYYKIIIRTRNILFLI